MSTAQTRREQYAQIPSYAGAPHAFARTGPNSPFHACHRPWRIAASGNRRVGLAVHSDGRCLRCQGVVSTAWFLPRAPTSIREGITVEPTLISGTRLEQRRRGCPRRHPVRGATARPRLAPNARRYLRRSDRLGRDRNSRRAQPRAGARAGDRPVIAPHPASAQSFLLQRVQPAMTGLIDGALSTLAPIFAVALARRRIERDLHDGAQQRLVSLGLELRAAEQRVPSEIGELRGDVSRWRRTSRASSTICARCRAGSTGRFSARAGSARR
jgi:hypothetical protein